MLVLASMFFLTQLNGKRTKLHLCPFWAIDGLQACQLRCPRNGTVNETIVSALALQATGSFSWEGCKGRFTSPDTGQQGGVPLW
jgi:hypothetical protein